MEYILDFIMRLFGYENIDTIKIPKDYRTPRADKLQCKAKFYAATGEFQDKVIVNNQNILLDGFITFKISKWNGVRYIKVLRIDIGPEEYKQKYRGYRLKNRERKQ